jgi:hypothetical protein
MHHPFPENWITQQKNKESRIISISISINKKTEEGFALNESYCSSKQSVLFF